MGVADGTLFFSRHGTTAMCVKRKKEAHFMRVRKEREIDRADVGGLKVGLKGDGNGETMISVSFEISISI